MTTEPASDPAAAPSPTASASRPPLARPSATGVGSLPGQEMAESIRLVMGELGERPGVPFLPELPQRGVGADTIGRGTAFLVELYAEVEPSGWRIADGPGRVHRRAGRCRCRGLDL